jgi:hypothetical protein
MDERRKGQVPRLFTNEVVLWIDHDSSCLCRVVLSSVSNFITACFLCSKSLELHLFTYMEPLVRCSVSCVKYGLTQIVVVVLSTWGTGSFYLIGVFVFG